VGAKPQYRGRRKRISLSGNVVTKRLSRSAAVVQMFVGRGENLLEKEAIITERGEPNHVVPVA